MARDSLLAEVATLYYVDGLSQEVIARRIDRSVATVSRLLAKAKATDIVEVHVRYPVPVAPVLQDALVNRFGLRVARVVRTSAVEAPHLLALVSDLAARYISTILTDGAVIAVAWGTAVRGAVRAIIPGQHRGLQIVQGLGSLGSRLPAVDNPLLIQLFADRVEGTPHYLSAPMIVTSRAVRDALAADPHFRETLRLCSRADIALVGIGEANPQRSGLCRAGYLDPREMERIRDSGAVGDILVEFFDLQGRILETDVTHRVMGMREKDLRNAGTVIAVATGTVKVPAILGALRSGLVHVLVTDDATARGVLDLDDAIPRERSTPRHETPDARQAPLERTEGQRRAATSRPAMDLRAVAHGCRPRRAPLAPETGACSGSEATGHRSGLANDLAAILSPIVEREQRLAHDPVLVETAFPAENRVGGECLRNPFDHLETLRSVVIAAIERARARGEIVAGADGDALADMLVGALWYRARISQAPLDGAFLHETIAVITHGLEESRLARDASASHG